MRPYYEYIKNAFKERFAYRIEYIVGIVQRFLALFVQLYLWRALLGQSGPVAAGSGTVSVEDMTTYVLVSILINTFIGNTVINDINDRVRGGQISTDLIKPINFQAYVFSRMLGMNLFRFIFQLLPVLAIGFLILDVQVPTLPYLLLFLFSVFNALIIMFLITFCVGILSFWYMSIWQLSLILSNVIQLFAGRWLPLWFFPEALLRISDFLPFRLLYFAPISVYLGKVEFGEAWFLVVQQLIWIVILFSLSRLMWYGAVRKLVIQGG
ncbi:MAG: ABC-2 family transporter protein [Dehalococcoidales bacterium]|nr:ABC-2 family transporter protein [Dehalococcoidales bacterium]